MSLRMEYRWTHILSMPVIIKLRNSTLTIGNRILPYLFLLLFWEAGALVMQIRRGVPFPTPVETLARAMELFSGADFLQYTIYQHIGTSMIRWGLGFILALVIGILLGIVSTLSTNASRVILPLTAFLQPIPSLAWIPLAILLLGLGTQSTIFIIFLAGVFPIIINVTAGIKSVPTGFLRASRMMGAKQRIILARVLIPGSLPHLLSGLRTALANGWRALIAAEMVGGTDLGLGYAIFQSRWSLDYPSSFVSIVVIAMIGVVIERGFFQLIETRTIEKWGMTNKGGPSC